jgi:hypothetical protein
MIALGHLTSFLHRDSYCCLLCFIFCHFLYICNQDYLCAISL